jgi:hypothetical protein
MSEKRKFVQISGLLMPKGMGMLAIDSYGDAWFQLVPLEGKEKPWVKIPDLPQNFKD